MQEQKNELLELRSQIAAQAKQLTLDSTGDPDARLQILMEVIRSGESTLDIYKTTYEVIQQLSDDDDKVSAMLGLIYEIDKDIAVQGANTDSNQ